MECGWDGGDCCGQHTCNLCRPNCECRDTGDTAYDVNDPFGMNGLECLDCAASNWYADKYCDDANNTPQCNYDGGDCCGANINRQFCSACQCLDPASPYSINARANDGCNSLYSYVSYWCYGIEDIGQLATTGLVTFGQMALPQLAMTGTLEAEAAIVPRFAGPQPGTVGGGVSPLATGSLSAISSALLSAGSTIFIGLALIGAGQLVSVFDFPRSDDNFAAVAGIFEEGNVGQRRGKREINQSIFPVAKWKREISQLIVRVAKSLLWINQTIEKGIIKILQYVHTFIGPDHVQFTLLNWDTERVLVLHK